MEERVLKLRDENMSLKKTVREQELQLKKLQTKLIRTEAAARKAVKKVGSGTFSTNAATDLQGQLLQTELRVSELEEKNEQLHAKAEREKQKVLHFQKLAKEYKAKTDSSAKLRHFRNAVKAGPNNRSSLRDSQELPTKARTGAKAVEVGPLTSNFQHVDVEGTDFIMHSETLKLYQWKGGKLRPYGLLVDGNYQKADQARDLLLALDQYLKSHRKRLIELFEELDSRQKGVVPLERIVSLVSNVLGDPTEAETDYFRGCIDVTSKGKISYADMMSALRDVTATSQAQDGGSLRFSTVCDKVLNVLLFRKQEARKVFKRQCDENGHLTFTGVSKYLRTLVPTLSSSDVRICLSAVRRQDVQNVGKVMFIDILITFGAIEKNKLPKKPKAEVAERSIQEVQKNLGLTDPAFQLGLTSLPSDKQFSDIAVARRQIERLENRYSESQRLVEDMKVAQKRLVDQLEETNEKLAEERKHGMMLEVEQKKLVFDIQGTRDLKPMLEQAQKDILELERENHQLMSSAIKAPQAALNELKNARWDAIEHQKQRNAAELRETELRRELASMKKQLSNAGSYSGADILSVRVERDNAVKEVAKIKIELEALNEKLKVYQALKSDEAKAEIDPEDSIGSAMRSVALTGSEKEMSYELKHLQEAYAKQTLELEKLHLVLRHEEERCADLVAENESLRTQLESAKASYDKRLAAYQNELNMKQERISKLEAKLCLSTDVADFKGSQKSRNEEDVLHDIELKENEDLLVLSIHSVSYSDVAAFDSSTSSFLVVDFYEHEPQTSDVVQGLQPRLDTSFQFVVAVDNFFISYMNSRNVLVEVNKVSGLDYQVVGAAEIPLRQMLSEKYSGDLRACDIFGDGDKLVGKLFYSIEFQNNLIRELKADLNIPGLDSKPPGYMATGIEVDIESCSGLVLPDTRNEDIIPYFSYKLLDLCEHDTVFGTGRDSAINDKNFIKAKWTPELRDALYSGKLELKCFHDGDAPEESLIGECKIEMQTLADGIPIEGSFTLYSRGRAEAGQVKVHIQWIDKMASKKEKPLQVEPEAPEKERVEEQSSRQIEEYTALSEMVQMDTRELEKDNHDLDIEPKEVTPMEEEIEVVSESDLTEHAVSTPVGDPKESSEAVSEEPAMEEEDLQLDVGGQSSFVELPTATMKLPDLSSNIVIHISKIELTESMMGNSAVEQVCVVFDFMTTYVDAKSQCTPMKPKISSVVDFSHTQVFCLDEESNAGMREHLLTLIADGSDDESSSIPFCLVAEGNGEQSESESMFQDIAYCEVNLMSIFKEMKDLNEKEIPMLTPEGTRAATLYLSVFAVGVLESFM